MTSTFIDRPLVRLKVSLHHDVAGDLLANAVDCEHYPEPNYPEPIDAICFTPFQIHYGDFLSAHPTRRFSIVEYMHRDIHITAKENISREKTGGALNDDDAYQYHDNIKYE